MARSQLGEVTEGALALWRIIDDTPAARAELGIPTAT